MRRWRSGLDWRAPLVPETDPANAEKAKDRAVRSQGKTRGNLELSPSAGPLTRRASMRRHKGLNPHPCAAGALDWVLLIML
jgi:hypothetical protein